MSNTDKGVLIFNEWFDAMENLSANDFKTLMCAVYHYQIHGKKPPVFKGKAAFVAKILFPYIDRRLAQSRAGKISAEMRAEVSSDDR